MIRICLEQGEKLKRQASDATKQIDKQAGGFVDKLKSIFNDVKNSVFGK